MTARYHFHSISIAIFLFMLLPSVAFPANCNSTSNGNWSTPGIWTCGTVPNSGDAIIIDANRVVTINSNLTYGGNPMHVTVYGIWRFTGGGAKITLPCNSSVIIGFGGKVEGNGTGNSQTVRICNTVYWSASDSTVSGPMGWPVNVLPVELIAFKGIADDRGVNVNWTTASERDSHFFQLMRSRDGTHWDAVATVAAAGQSATVRNYTLRDLVPGPGEWFYGLQQYDVDDSMHDLGMIAVVVKGDGRLICGPIPVTDGTIDVFLDGGDARLVELISNTGRVSYPTVLFREQDRLRVDVSKVPAGTHLIVVTDHTGGRRSCRLFIP